MHKINGKKLNAKARKSRTQKKGFIMKMSYDPFFCLSNFRDFALKKTVE